MSSSKSCTCAVAPPCVSSCACAISRCARKLDHKYRTYTAAPSCVSFCEHSSSLLPKNFCCNIRTGMVFHRYASCSASSTSRGPQRFSSKCYTGTGPPRLCCEIVNGFDKCSSAGMFCYSTNTGNLYPGTRRTGFPRTREDPGCKPIS